MTSPSKLCKDVITKVISFLSELDLFSILKIDDESIDTVKLVKSVASSKLFEKGKMLNIKVGSIPGMDLIRMEEDEKNSWFKAVICQVRTPRNKRKDWSADTICKVHLLPGADNYKRYFQPGADETVSIKATEPQWIPCYCGNGPKCDLCKGLELPR